VASEFTIDAQSGRLRPIRPGETSCVTVLTPDEYLKRTPAHVLQQVMHSLNNVRRSSCVQLGDLVFGNVYIPKDVQRAAGFDAKSSLGFSYELDGDNLTIIMEEEDQGEERAFLALSLVDQYLDKSTPVSFIPEMIVMLAMRISVWIREYEDRLATLESNLNGDVYEMPKGLSEFLSNARRELGTIEGFCRQTGDMLEDITRIASSRGNERASVNCAAISRQIARLALDAGEVREYAGEIRASFQERIEVRQNNVMSLLTIVETVFTPLALVTGWYGMNFVNMPELKHPDAYFIVVAVLVFFIVLEFSIFKRRRWF
jgi:magnesium transporter